MASAFEIRSARFIWVLLLSAAVLAAVGAAYYARRSQMPLPGQAYPSAGTQHVGFADPLPRPYTSNPPSSGPHFGQSANWGVYDYEVNERIVIHNLEHGGIWISYNPATASRAAIEQLQKLVQDFGTAKLVMSPRSANDTDVALAAWERVLKFDVHDRLSEEQLEEARIFIARLKNRGPEFVPDSAPGIDPRSAQP